jgi:hypothetical protein
METSVYNHVQQAFSHKLMELTTVQMIHALSSKLLGYRNNALRNVHNIQKTANVLINALHQIS